MVMMTVVKSVTAAATMTMTSVQMTAMMRQNFSFVEEQHGEAVREEGEAVHTSTVPACFQRQAPRP
ncbi:hypothetical protein E2C01_087942 [Portunus trituberculatus]|uniref:Uncharacterized protein n=1 Tax=Portunus trituberculatus TaxID=210409 RepID=A0A5B7J9G4_PORTR|nr:hypothetical protein [Portunus trituberculatus]